MINWIAQKFLAVNCFVFQPANTWWKGLKIIKAVLIHHYHSRLRQDSFRNTNKNCNFKLMLLKFQTSMSHAKLFFKNCLMSKFLTLILVNKIPYCWGILFLVKLNLGTSTKYMNHHEFLTQVFDAQILLLNLFCSRSHGVKVRAAA